jgi:hypothetical protein
MGQSGEVQTMVPHDLSRSAFVFTIRGALVVIACSLAPQVPAADSDSTAGTESISPLFVTRTGWTHTGRPGEINATTGDVESNDLARCPHVARACMRPSEQTGGLNRIRDRGIEAPDDQVAERGGLIQPPPIQVALDLLKWSPDHVPTIEIVETRPPRVSPLAEGWILYDVDGRPRPTIYVAAWSALYRAVLARRLDFQFEVIRLAGVLAHERAHIEHGPDEESAYLAQLITLERLRARDIDLANVRRALETAKRHPRALSNDAR